MGEGWGVGGGSGLVPLSSRLGSATLLSVASLSRQGRTGGARWGPLWGREGEGGRLLHPGQGQ